MNSSTFKSPPCFPFTRLSKCYDCNPKHAQFKLIKQNESKFFLTCTHSHRSVLNLNSLSKKLNNKKPNQSIPCFSETENSVGTTTSAELVRHRIQRLVSEFKSLTEPIDRVKRLLDYAARLPPFDEWARSPENRVTGCTTQVWLEAKMDENERMRFRADSDSEITKGFISCLISLFDGAEPEEVAAVKAEDLEAMNVGLYGKAQSRVNTWHNLLISMKKRSEALAAERKGRPQMEPLPSLVVAADGARAKGSINEAQQSRWQKLDSNLSRS